MRDNEIHRRIRTSRHSPSCNRKHNHHRHRHWELAHLHRGWCCEPTFQNPLAALRTNHHLGLLRRVVPSRTRLCQRRPSWCSRFHVAGGSSSNCQRCQCPLCHSRWTRTCPIRSPTPHVQRRGRPEFALGRCSRQRRNDRCKQCSRQRLGPARLCLAPMTRLGCPRCKCCYCADG